MGMEDLKSKTKMSVSAVSIGQYIGNPSQCYKARKQNQRHKDQKRRNKISMFADDPTGYVENTQDSGDQL